MGRNEEMKKRKEEKEKWERAELLRKMEETGMAYVEREIVDDDVVVEETILTSLLSMIPGTKAYADAKASEEEMDDLGKIRIEKAKANDLLALAKMPGKHEEALEKMMAETNNDFFYFNKLKDKYTKEGKYSYKEQDMDPFRDIGSKKNRFRKAIRMQFDMIQKSSTINLAARVDNANDKDAAIKKLRALRNLPCSWRGKSKDGEFLQCMNARHLHPHMTYKDESNKLQHEALTTCAYHATVCCGEHPPDQPQKILVPNSEAYCNECHIDHMGEKPTALSMEKAPGVSSLNNMANLRTKMDLAAAKMTGEGDNQLTDDSICNWKPSGSDANSIIRLYKCTNKVFRDPESKVLYPTCAYHVKRCVRKHETEATAIITTPNVYGLCVSHHMAEHRDEPPHIANPYPGMVKKLYRREVKFKTGHWAAPYWPPLRNVEVVTYEPIIHEDVVEIMFAWAARVKRFWLRVFRKHKAILRLQRVWRGFLVRHSHRALKMHKMMTTRLKAIMLMQSFGRMCNAKRVVSLRRKMFMSNALKVQKIYRGHVTRCFLKRVRAARRIQQVCRRFRIWKFQDAVIMVMQIKRSFRKRLEGIVLMQRIIRGGMARHFVLMKKLHIFTKKHAVKVIMHEYRQYKVRRAIVYFRYPTEEWAKVQCGRRLAMMIWEMLYQQNQRYMLQHYTTACAVPVQRLVRGFLARRGYKQLNYLRNAIRTWCKPEFATEFFRRHLENTSLNFALQKPLKKARGPLVQQSSVISLLSAATQDTSNDIASTEGFIRRHLPVEYQRAVEVDIRIVHPAITRWYLSIGAPLLGTELDALIRLFRNSVDNTIPIHELDDYIGLHTEPCSMHGRTICGDCSFKRECRKFRCKCRKYHGNGKPGGACVTCVHPPFAHRKVPLRLRVEAKLKSPSKEGVVVDKLRESIEVMRAPDISIPTQLGGITIDYAIERPPSPVDLYHKSMELEARNYRSKLTTIRAVPKTLKRSLAKLEVDAKKMEHSNEYWKQKNIGTIRGVDVGVQALNVQADKQAPPLDVNETKFWSKIVAKNPNKNVRHYDETFEHNIPFPIVQNKTLVYTLEGPRLYLNILLRLIKMENVSNLHDHADFLRLICDHIQLFERHWRKIIADLRKGVLNRHVKIPENARKVYESTCIPRPRFAEKMDATFRALGFHKKALGKDIQIQPYALTREEAAEEDRKAKIIADNALAAKLARRTAASGFGGFSIGSNLAKYAEALPTKTTAAVGVTHSKNAVRSLMKPKSTAESSIALRRPSEPAISRGIDLGLKAEDFGFDESVAAGRDNFLLGSMGTCVPCKDDRSHASRKMSRSQSSRMGTAIGSGTARGSRLRPNSAKDERGESRLSPSRGSGTANMKEVLMSLGSSVTGGGEVGKLKQIELERSMGGPNHRRPGDKRRGSDTDMLHPTTMAMIQKQFYETDVAPRGHYHEALKVSDDNRFLCPFPACGKSFPTKESAFAHIPSHEQRLRLGIPTPLPDSHLHHYWPAGTPWLESLKYQDRVIPPGSLVCSFIGCKEIFPDKARLALHKRLAHNDFDFSHTKKGYFTMQGSHMQVPPNEPPIDAPIYWCPNHINASSKCIICIDVENRFGPKPPMKYYESVNINFKAHTDMINKLEEMRIAQLDKNVLQSRDLNPLDQAIADRFPNAEYGYKNETDQVVFTRGCNFGLYILSTGSRLVKEPVTGLLTAGVTGGPGARNSINNTSMLPSIMQRRRKKGAKTNIFEDEDGRKKERFKMIWQGRVIALGLDKSDVGWVCIEPLFTHKELETYMGVTQWREWCPADFNKKHELVPANGFLIENFTNVDEVPTYLKDARETKLGSICRWVKIYDVIGKFNLRTSTPDDFKRKVKAKSLSQRNSYFVRPVVVEEG